MSFHIKHRFFRAALASLHGVVAGGRQLFSVFQRGWRVCRFIGVKLGGRRLLVLIARLLERTDGHPRQRARIVSIAAFGTTIIIFFLIRLAVGGEPSTSAADYGPGTTLEQQSRTGAPDTGGPESTGALAVIPSLPGNDTDAGESGAIVTEGNSLTAPAMSITRLESRLRDSIETYVVQDGDTIGTIAEQFGISQQTILWENKLTARSVIRPGQELAILPTSGLSHSVAKGETVASIAKRYKVDEREIREFNELSDDARLAVGQKVVVPEGTPPAIVIARPRTPVRGTPSTPSTGSITNIGLINPTTYRRVSQWFSYRHTGVDLAGPTGTPIHAAEDGVVVRAGWATGYGLHVLIDHGNGFATRYGHSSKVLVKVGDRVTKGQLIMLMGSTGKSTGPHLHFEVIQKGQFVNPSKYIKF